MNTDNIKVTRNNNLFDQVVFVDGQAGCGKTLITAIVNSFKRVELFNYAPEIENICILEFLKKISEDSSEALIKNQMDLCLYETMMSRRVNFRFKDLSSPVNNYNFFKYFIRLFSKGDEEVPKKIINEKPILHYAVHNLLSFSNPIFRALNNKNLLFIEVLRHPLYMIIQNTINHKNLEKNKGYAKFFRVYLNKNNIEYPFQFYNNYDLYEKLNSVEKAIYDINFFTNRTENFKSKLNDNENKKIITIPFEKYVLNPIDFNNLILNYLGTNITNKTKKTLIKQKVPRKKISDGISLSVYKRFGWSPPIKGFTEKDELDFRRKFVENEGVSKEYLDILDKLSANYEKKYLNGIL